MRTARVAVVVLLVSLAFVGGCRRTGSFGKTSTRVSGTVTLRGQPLADGHVRFESADGRTPFLSTVRDGRYSASCTRLVTPGQYHVTIRYTSENRTGGRRLDQTATRTCTLGLGDRHTVNFDLE